MYHFRLNAAILFSLIFFVSCNPKECCDVFDPEQDCAENIACTEVFVTVSVPFQFNLVTKNQLGYSVTILKSTGVEIYRHSYTNDQIEDESFAFLADDSDIDQINKSGNEMIYTLYDKSGNQIIRENFTIAHDCCHVLKKIGKDMLTI